jgi:hypothetical protein
MTIWPIIKSVGGAEVIIWEIGHRPFTFEVDVNGSLVSPIVRGSFWAMLNNRANHISVNRRFWGKVLKVMVLK